MKKTATYAYLRLDGDSPLQRKELMKVIGDYATRLGLGVPPSEFIIAEHCNLLEPLDRREAFSEMRRRLSEGDRVIVSHFGAIGAHPSSFEKFLREVSSKGVDVFCAELDTELSSKLSNLRPLLQMYAHWETEVALCERRLEDKDHLHSEMLQEYSKLAVQAAVERFMKADIAGALGESMRAATVNAALVVQGKKRFSVAHLHDERSLEKLKRTHPQIYDNIRRAQRDADIGVE